MNLGRVPGAHGRTSPRGPIAVLAALGILGATGCAAVSPQPQPSPSPSGSPGGGIHSSVVVVIPDRSGGPAPAAGAPPGSPPAGDQPTAGDGIVVPPDSLAAEERRLAVIVDRRTVYIRNGGRIELGDGLAAEIFLDPYPPSTLHTVVDIYVTRDGEPADDASVDVEFDMLAMAHGPFGSAARDIGGGHHLVTLDYIMFGAWEQSFTLRIGLDRIRIPVVIVAYP